MSTKLGKKIIFTALVTAFIIGFSTTASAATEESWKEADVNISIASSVAVDLHPTNLTYRGMDVGSMQTKTSTFGDGTGYESVDIENVGSEYISNIWVNATTPSSDPFGTGLPSAYDSGNFLMIKPNNASSLLKGDSDEYHYVNRVEFATGDSDEIPSYINAPHDGSEQYAQSGGGTGNPDEVYVGRFRVGEAEYFYAIPANGDPATCDGTGTFNTLLVAKEPHTSDRTVPIDFTNSSVDDNGFPAIPGKDYVVYELAENSEPDTTKGVVSSLLTPTWDEDANSESGVTLTVDPSEYSALSSELNRSYAVMTDCGDDGARVARTRYNIELEGSDDLTGTSSPVPPANYLMNTDNADQMLVPGGSVTFDMAAEVPRGVPEGNIPMGTLSVLIQADDAAQK